MSKIGFVGLGKLGLPVATAMALRGADVMGFDLDSTRMSYNPQPYQEAGPNGDGDFNHWLEMFLGGKNPGSVRVRDGVVDEMTILAGRLAFGSLEHVCNHADLIFVAVQTPHDPRYEGITPLDGEPVDFDYTYLRNAVEMLLPLIKRQTAVAIISTVLPGTMEREIKPLLEANPLAKLCYNPAFIAMGTTMYDFLNPEFVLLGIDDKWAVDKVQKFYTSILPGEVIRTMSVASAELTKVAYNTAISQKIALANTVMEICHKTPGADCDDVTSAMKAAYRRVSGGAYMDGGMGDGGGCHPRDNIALSWLARKLNLSYDPFDAAMRGREAQSGWLRSLITQVEGYYQPQQRHVVIVGYAYKPGTNITTGSPALLLQHQLMKWGRRVFLWDPHVDPNCTTTDFVKYGACTYFVGCRHSEFEGTGLTQHLVNGSIVIDPFRMVADSDNHTVLPIGTWDHSNKAAHKEIARRMTTGFPLGPKLSDYEKRHGAK